MPKAKVEFQNAERTFAVGILQAAKETKRGPWLGLLLPRAEIEKRAIKFGCDYVALGKTNAK